MRADKTENCTIYKCTFDLPNLTLLAFVAPTLLKRSKDTFLGQWPHFRGRHGAFVTRARSHTIDSRDSTTAALFSGLTNEVVEPWWTFLIVLSLWPLLVFDSDSANSNHKASLEVTSGWKMFWVGQLSYLVIHLTRSSDQAETELGRVNQCVWVYWLCNVDWALFSGWHDFVKHYQLWNRCMAVSHWKTPC